MGVEFQNELKTYYNMLQFSLDIDVHTRIRQTHELRLKIKSFSFSSKSTKYLFTIVHLNKNFLPYQRDAYELPQTFRNKTFPRTIITPDNLENSPPDQSLHDNGVSTELFVSYRVSHGPSLQHTALADQQNREIGRYLSGPDTTWRESHERGTYQHHSSLMTPEDNYSISSSEMTI